MNRNHENKLYTGDTNRKITELGIGCRDVYSAKIVCQIL